MIHPSVFYLDVESILDHNSGAVVDHGVDQLQRFSHFILFYFFYDTANHYVGRSSGSAYFIF